MTQELTPDPTADPTAGATSGPGEPGDPDFLLAAALAGLGHLTPQMMLAVSPGEAKNPVGTERLREYWTTGEGAARIGWRTPGDMTRCMQILKEYLPEREVPGYCARLHFRAVGYWPGDRRNQ